MIDPFGSFPREPGRAKVGALEEKGRVMTSQPLPEPTPGEQPSADSRNWGMIAHLSALVMFVGIPAPLGPLVVWLIKKDQDPYVDYHGKESLNFNISFLLYSIVAGVLILVVIGLVLLPLVGIAWLVLVILGAVRASSGEMYRYPLTIRFIS